MITGGFYAAHHVSPLSGGSPMPKSRKRPAAAAKASAARLRQPDGGSAGAPRWSTVPRATYGRSRPAPPPGKEWPRFSGAPWHTWMAMQAMQDCTPTQLALAEVTPWRIAPESDARAEWTSLAARSEEHTSELQSRSDLVCRLLLEKKK